MTQTPWLDSLHAALDALEGAAASQGDTTAALHIVTVALSALEARLPALSPDERAATAALLPQLLARLAAVEGAVRGHTADLARQLGGIRARASALKHYGGVK